MHVVMLPSKILLNLANAQYFYGSLDCYQPRAVAIELREAAWRWLQAAILVLALGLFLVIYQTMDGSKIGAVWTTIGVAAPVAFCLSGSAVLYGRYLTRKKINDSLEKFPYKFDGSRWEVSSQWITIERTSSRQCYLGLYLLTGDQEPTLLLEQVDLSSLTRVEKQALQERMGTFVLCRSNNLPDPVRISVKDEIHEVSQTQLIGDQNFSIAVKVLVKAGDRCPGEDRNVELISALVNMPAFVDFERQCLLDSSAIRGVIGNGIIGVLTSSMEKWPSLSAGFQQQLVVDHLNEVLKKEIDATGIFSSRIIGVEVSAATVSQPDVVATDVSPAS